MKNSSSFSFLTRAPLGSSIDGFPNLELLQKAMKAAAIVKIGIKFAEILFQDSIGSPTKLTNLFSKLMDSIEPIGPMLMKPLPINLHLGNIKINSYLGVWFIRNFLGMLLENHWVP